MFYNVYFFYALVLKFLQPTYFLKKEIYVNGWIAYLNMIAYLNFCYPKLYVCDYKLYGFLKLCDHSVSFA